MAKKGLKKVSIFLSTVMMMLCMMSIMAFATPTIGPNPPSSGSITIAKEGAAFTAYKILNAVKSGDAYNYVITAEFENFFNNPAYGNFTQDSLKELAQTGRVKEFASYLHKYVIDKGISSSISIKGNEKKTVELGYYLILESSKDSSGDAVVSTAMVTSVPKVDGNAWLYDIQINPKDNTPTLDKKIVEADGRKVETSSANIGDVIKYEVSAAIPTYEQNAKNIVYKFKDTMSKGLTYDEAVGFTVTSGSHTFIKGTDYTVVSSKDPVTQITTINIDFVYDNIKAYANDGLVLKYQAKLNENAVISTGVNNGNPNDIELKYTNNPDIADSYKTLTDKVISYTWGIGVRKVDADNIVKDLAGAEFAIRNASGDNLGKYTYDESGKVVILEGNLKTDLEGVVTVVGLEEGDYYIHEVKAPEGYALLKEPVHVKITATKNVGGDYTGAATISIPTANEAAEKINDITMEDNNILFNIQIKNYAGISLPGTGGMGTNGFAKIAISLLAISSVLGLGYLVVEKKKRA